MALTLFDGEDRCEIGGTRAEGALRLDPAGVAAELGWELKEQGLCRGDVCIPVRDRAALTVDGHIDLAALAGLLDRPVAMDVEHGVAVLGESAGERHAQLASGLAPDFTLPDIEGQLHSLSDHRGKKVLLVAYASW